MNQREGMEAVEAGQAPLDAATGPAGRDGRTPGEGPYRAADRQMQLLWKLLQRKDGTTHPVCTEGGPGGGNQPGGTQQDEPMEGMPSYRVRTQDDPSKGR